MIEYAFVTDKGVLRGNNEDSVVIGQEIYNDSDERGSGASESDTLSAAVFDGVGGNAGGERASLICAENFVKLFAPEKISGRVDAYSAMSTINGELIAAQEAGEYKKMMSTAVFVIVKEDCFIFGNSGDSRGYMIDDEGIEKYSYDDTYKNKLLKDRSVSPEEAENPMYAHVITDCFGIKNFDEYRTHIYVVPRNRSKTHYVCLTSDGVTDVIGDEEIKDAVLLYDRPKRIVEKIENKVRERRSADNYSIVLLKIYG